MNNLGAISFSLMVKEGVAAAGIEVGVEIGSISAILVVRVEPRREAAFIFPFSIFFS